MVTVGVAAVLVGLAVPLLCVSVIGFLLFDGLVQAWRDRAAGDQVAEGADR